MTPNGQLPTTASANTQNKPKPRMARLCIFRGNSLLHQPQLIFLSKLEELPIPAITAPDVVLVSPTPPVDPNPSHQHFVITVGSQDPRGNANQVTLIGASIFVGSPQNTAATPPWLTTRIDANDESGTLKFIASAQAPASGHVPKGIRSALFCSFYSCACSAWLLGLVFDTAVLLFRTASYDPLSKLGFTLWMTTENRSLRVQSIYIE